ncbi:MAG: ABC transporter ATP-binding protein/permease [[Bacteroides] pectinophilus]|nr:ABC transporter ATP-binding protein/permease [[Bacteroides] pectinophilus]
MQQTKKKISKKIEHPDRIIEYFKEEWIVLLAVTISGMIYNVGLLAGPWFEGKMTGCLVNILGGSETFADMLILVALYVISIAVVQISRYIKRFYVRRFSNNVNKHMKQILYGSLVHKSRAQLQEEGVGNVMTKAILDVDDCVEGMRKFTTEIFDTGVAMVAYMGMLLWYDWRLALLCMIFPPVSYYIAERMKVIVQKTGAAYKVQSGILSAATLDRANNAVTYRVFGCEGERRESYEKNLTDYEKSAVLANIWNSSLQPIYRIISMTGVIFILYFGGKNVLGVGWREWSVAAFATFLACFTKLAVKSSKAAKLFNAVHKAQVSWKRIKPLMVIPNDDAPQSVQPVRCADTLESVPELTVNRISFAYPESKNIYSGISFSAKPGEIIGVTGPVACGKSTLGKTFLCEYPYDGSIRLSGRELKDMTASERTGLVGYLGHDPELFNDSIANNVMMGDKGDCRQYLKTVCIDEEVNAMEDGTDTLVGSGGVRLSGGQAQRLALARTLCHMKHLMVLDDSFSALDKNTEVQVFNNLRAMTQNNIVILISHRLYLFPQMSRIIWMDGGRAIVGTHEQLMEQCPEYANLYLEQAGGGSDEKWQM